MLSMGRPWSPLSVRLVFWKGLDEGLPLSVAARAAGVSRATAYRWLSEYRQVLPSSFQNFAVTRAGSLSLREREEIRFHLARGQGVGQIAAKLARAPLPISTEGSPTALGTGVSRMRGNGPFTLSYAQTMTSRTETAPTAMGGRLVCRLGWLWRCRVKGPWAGLRGVGRDMRCCIPREVTFQLSQLRAGSHR